jgi:hypothetical protein
MKLADAPPMVHAHVAADLVERAIQWDIEGRPVVNDRAEACQFGARRVEQRMQAQEQRHDAAQLQVVKELADRLPTPLGRRALGIDRRRAHLG